MSGNNLDGLAADIRAEHEASKDAAKRAVYHAMKCGKLLIQVKEGFRHGQWIPWLKDSCQISVRTAQAYMRLSRRHAEMDAEEAQRITHLSLRDALDCVAEAVPKPVCHPLCLVFPYMREKEYRPFLRSIKRDGLRHPIVVLSDGSIIDGKCRFVACIEAGVEPRTVAYEGSEDWESLKEFVISQNLVRRSMNYAERLEYLKKVRAYLVEKGEDIPAWIDEDFADFA